MKVKFVTAHTERTMELQVHPAAEEVVDAWLAGQRAAPTWVLCVKESGWPIAVNLYQFVTAEKAAS